MYNSGISLSAIPFFLPTSYSLCWLSPHVCVRAQRAYCPSCLPLSALVLATIHLMIIHYIPEHPGLVDRVSVLSPGATEGVDGEEENSLMFSHPSLLHDTISQSNIETSHFSKVLY